MWQCAKRCTVHCDSEAGRHLFCDSLAMFTVSNVRLGAGGVRAGGWVDVLVPGPLLSVPLTCTATIHSARSMGSGGGGEGLRKEDERESKN